MTKATTIGIVLLLGGCTGSGCNAPPTPSSETCSGAARGDVTTLDIGTFDGTTYTQYQDGDVIPMITGGQGSPMLVINLRARGADLGSCLPQSTVLSNAGGEPVYSEEQPLVIRQVLADTWISGEALLISYDVYSGGLATIETTAGGVTASVSLWVDYEPLPDAGALAY